MTPYQQRVGALKIPRYFTKPGTDAYDMVQWEDRESKIVNPGTGEIVFHQSQVEMPTSWSINSTNIVAQKYFVGTPGDPGREESLRDLINRVADTITEHGLKEGYFVDEDEAVTYNQELKYILVTQRAAFNSPVWFNIGAPDRRQQASACFILSVEDDMKSILNWYVEEGMIFKGGSGAGLNLSRIRASSEPLRGSAGKASGPLSFMRGADSSAGAIKSGGKTRRAAKMVILDVDHPDIERFIWSKAREERKALALQAAGFDMSLNGEDIHSIQYQNANNSVRVNDEFMHAVENDEDWDLVGRMDEKVYNTVKARDLWQQIAKASHECADPGLQFDTTINKWHTTPNAGRINGSNPCSEYMHLDNSACNLASINLLKYLSEDGSFDIDAFRHTVEVVFLGQEILVGYSEYPTESIAKNAVKYRQLGMGYANLGALLMAQGLPYDSDAGRAQAAAVTAFMTGQAYATSAKIAKRVGPFAGYADDEEGMNKVLRMHRDEVNNIDAKYVAEDLLNAATIAWDQAVELGRVNGVRNAQASVLAPTGTIGLMMDCDTTGIEPDLSLVKMKNLVGGGTMNIVNRTVPRALDNLGYDPAQVKAIVDYVDEEKTIVGAPELKTEHLPVFACSMGDNVIHYTGHAKMMGAVQPFLSGAISKTVNMPADASVEDVADIHFDSWKLGLKAVAIYRDNSKVAQPLNTAEKETKDDAPLAEAKQSAAADFTVKGVQRRELGKVRDSRTYDFKVAGTKGYFTVTQYEDGTPAELFLKVSKQGSTLAGVMDALAISVSQGLQYGVPIKSYVKTFTNMTFAPSGLTDDTDIRTASSLVDYIFRRIGKDYLSYDDQLETAITMPGDPVSEQVSLPVEDDPADDEASVQQHTLPSDDQVEDTPKAAKVELPQQPSVEDTAPLCSFCGNITQRSGSCYVCTSCGMTTGCS